MIYVEAPDSIPVDVDDPCLFLGGGITNCPDWQTEMTVMLQDTNLVILNPRRSEFDFSKIDSTDQIKWEFDHLALSDIISFWFPAESICPIALFELGKWLTAEEYLGPTTFIGCHPEYPRRFDIEVQTALMDAEKEIYPSLETLVAAILDDPFVSQTQKA